MTHNPEHEKIVLAAIKSDNTVYDRISLTPEDFYDPQNAELYRCMRKIIESGREANDLSIADAIQNNGTSLKVSYVATIGDAVTTANAEYYAKTLRELARKRRIAKLVTTIKDALPSKKSSAILDLIEKEITSLSELNESSLRRAGDSLHDAIGKIEELYNLKGGHLGIPSGYTALDNLTDGFQDGDLIIIGARPSIGKTALALSMATNITLRHDTAVGFFSCEMDAKILLTRLLSAEAKINLSKVRSGHVTKDDFDRLMEVSQRVSKARFWIDDTPNIHLFELRSRARQMKRLGIQLIIVDYITLIRHYLEGNRRYEVVGDISKNLKHLARELQIPVIILPTANHDNNQHGPNENARLQNLWDGIEIFGNVFARLGRLWH